jgi:hypothetical protein
MESSNVSRYGGDQRRPDLKSERNVLRLLAAGANNEAVARHMN